MKDQSKSPDAERIRELLEKAAPPDAGSIGRADAVTRRARRARTSRGIAGGVGVAALAAAIVITPHFFTTSPTTNDATDPSNGVKDPSVVAAATALDNPCPEQDGLYDGTEGKSVIRDDVTSIRLCKIELSGVLAPAWSPPQDALIDPAAFLAALEGAEPADPSRCAAVTPLPDPMYYLVTYPDGSTDRAASYGYCSDVTVNGTPYTNDDVFKAFRNALADQRAGLEAPADVAAPDITCDTPKDARAFTRGPKPDGNTVFTSFAICGEEGPIEADAAVLDQFNEAWQAAKSYDAAPSCPPGEEVISRGGFATSTWGDAYAVAYTDCSTVTVGGSTIVTTDATRPLRGLG